MSFNALDHTSIIVDSVVMGLLSCLFITVTALASYGYVRMNVIQLDNVVVVLAIIACAYGIPISKVRKGYAKRFAITASVFAVLSLAVSLINSVVSRISRFAYGGERYASTTSPTALSVFTEVIVYLAAALMAVKYIRTFVMLTKEQQSMVVCAPVQGNFQGYPYPVQSAIVGRPLYQPS